MKWRGNDFNVDDFIDDDADGVAGGSDDEFLRAIWPP